MLFEFLNANRDELISRCRTKVANRLAPRPTEREIEHGIPVFLNQLIEILRQENVVSSAAAPSVSMKRDEARMADGIGKSADSHGNELLSKGFAVDQVVHDYGDLCQAITELAIE